jgi:hypothetical protein
MLEEVCAGRKGLDLHYLLAFYGDEDAGRSAARRRDPICAAAAHPAAIDGDQAIWTWTAEPADAIESVKFTPLASRWTSCPSCGRCSSRPACAFAGPGTVVLIEAEAGARAAGLPARRGPRQDAARPIPVTDLFISGRRQQLESACGCLQPPPPLPSAHWRATVHQQ